MAQRGRGNDMKARVELLAEWDRTSFTRIRSQFQKMADKDFGLNLRLEDIEVGAGWSKKIQDVLDDATSSLGSGLLTRFDREVGDILNQLVETRANIAAAEQKGLKAEASEMLAQQEALEKQLESLVDEVDSRADKIAKMRSQGWDFGPRGLVEAGSSIKDSFLDSLNEVKAGDLSGLAKSFVGGVGKAVKTGAGAAEIASASVQTEGLATALGSAAASLTVAAAGITVAAGAAAALVAVLAAADGQAKEFNRDLLDGAGVADLAFTDTLLVGDEMVSTLEAATQASINLAKTWRGQAKDYAVMLGELNQAGLTYRQMTKDAKDQAEQVAALEKYAETVLVYAKAFGVSTSQMTEDVARLSQEFGMTNDEIAAQYASIAAAAQTSGIGTKRFFTAVSQATAGMALYNARMDEAAVLLSTTAKILGGTDASDFVKSLTKGFVDESYQDRFKHLMLMGSDAASRFTESLDTAVGSFADTFKDSTAVREAFADALGDSAATLNIADPKELKALFAGMSREQQAGLKKSLFDAADHDPNAAAALRQLQSITELQRASGGSLSDMAGGMGELSMQAKLAAKMDNFMGTRLNEMSGTQKMAFEQTSGISGEQLEQLTRVEDVLWSVYASTNSLTGDAKTDQKNFLHWVATDKKAGKIAQDNADATKTAAELSQEYAKATQENTHSIVDILQAGVADVLKNIYDVMLQFWYAYRGLTPEQAKLQADALKANREAQASNQADLAEQTAKLDEAQQVLQAMLDKGMPPDASEVKAQEAIVTSLQETVTDLAAIGKANESASADIVTQLGKSAEYQAQGYSDTSALVLGIEGLGDMVSEFGEGLTGTDVYQGPLDAANAIEDAQGQSVSWLDNVGDALYGAGALMTGGTAQARGLFSGSDSEDTVDTLDQQASLAKKGVEQDKKGLAADKKFYDSGFARVNESSTVDALKQYEAWRLAQSLGLSGSDLDAAMAEYASGATAAGQGVLADAIRSSSLTMDTSALVDQAGLGGLVAHDFIMRPGQAPMRFDPADTVVGTKPGGPLAGGVTNVFNINGGDQGEVYRTVQRAIVSAGIRPGR